MAEFRVIPPEELDMNAFQAIGKDWMLVTAKNGEKANPMTASWGGVGVLWGKPVAYVFLRPQRLTRELVDTEDTFSLSFLSEDFRKQLALCGSQSGRDIDKVSECHFTVGQDGDTPYIAEAGTVLICKKLYRQPLEPGSFLDNELDTTHYPSHDYHVMYVVEITKVLVK